jgi:hypothetical protein
MSCGGGNLLRRALGLLIAAITVMFLVGAPQAVARDGVKAFDARGGEKQPCPTLEIGGFAGTSGGCEAFATSGRAEIVVLTMFGPLDFATCDIQFSLYVGPDGRTVIRDLVAFGVELNSPCGDILPCRRDVVEKLPWPGRIITAGHRYRNVADACFDTCLGRFEGRLMFDLLPSRAGGWRLRAAQAVAGASGFRIDGAWALKAGGLELRPSPASRRRG